VDGEAAERAVVRRESEPRPGDRHAGRLVRGFCWRIADRSARVGVSLTAGDPRLAGKESEKLREARTIGGALGEAAADEVAKRAAQTRQVGIPFKDP
jgi:hypothetical protein